MATRQAVVLIHGIGEQRPFETLYSFVSAIAGNKYFRNKPDKINPLYELRRLQMPGDRNKPQTDFYEFYWAHHMRDTKFRMITSWVKSLLLKNPCHYHPKFWLIYAILWLAVCLTVFYISCQALKLIFPEKVFFQSLTDPLKTLILLGILIVKYFLIRFIYGSIGDAARYLNPEPDNIAQRNQIRKEGIELLERLHESKKYVRIIIVGHSLGSVIGYDIIRNYWATLDKNVKYKRYKQIEPENFIESARELNEKTRPKKNDVELFQQAQHRLWREFQAIQYPWLITDFITLGSPLAHSAYLLAKTPEDFEIKKQKCEYPTCPPVQLNPNDIFFNFNGECEQGKCTVKIANHAAPFCCTRWTNIFFPSRNIFMGDFIGGPMANVFGRGIKDIALDLPKNKIFTHLKYWYEEPNDKNKKSPAQILKNNLNLDCLRAKGNWPLP